MAEGSIDERLEPSAGSSGALAHEVLTEDPGERVVRFMPSVKVVAAKATDADVAPEW